jgi:hypothetical protein
MLIEVKNFRNDRGDWSGKIHWIKRFREQTRVGLGEAKAVCDFCYDKFRYDPQVRIAEPFYVLDTERFTAFAHLDNNLAIRHGQCDIARMINGKNFKETDRELDDILNKIDAKILKPSKSAEQILKQTAITLIRGNHIRHAKGVLEILIK